MENWKNGAETSLRVAIPGKVNFQPGQYFLGITPLQAEALGQVFYPLEVAERFLTLSPMYGGKWFAGQAINLRGPLGNGFRVPASAERIGLIGYGQSKLASLIPLAKTFLVAGKEVALVTDLPVQGLPMALEILPTEQAAEVAGWADALAICAQPKDIPELMRVFNKEASRKSVEVLLQTEMPCAGVAACGVCAVLTKKGWQHVCKEGPVFSLADLVSE
jgi:NAD(P)H-flavin reductase